MARRWLLPLIAVLIGLLTAGVAQAAPPYTHERYSGSDSFDDTICGLAAHFDVEFSGVVTIRTVKGSDGQAFLAHDNYLTVETVTNPANGQQIVIRANGVFLEQHATHVSGNIWRFEARDAGTFTITDPAGHRLLRDRGVVVLGAVFDTLGDSQPGGVLVVEDPPVFHGPHSDDATFCGVVLDQLT
ncbi:hypothetical protein ACIBL3_40650 [Kribbella sp. NPDC050124]|uniref:hypothetical protein n=1 Tax=Kribbella sp. NPDC050124 TaxID=3364114 RepID=UPI0037A411CA